MSSESYVPVLYPSWRYHDTLPARIVDNEEEDLKLKRSDPVWRKLPYVEGEKYVPGQKDSENPSKGKKTSRAGKGE